MVAIVDYGVGNLFSLQCSLNAIGAEVTVTADPEVLKSADQVLLPGVGAFGDAADKLRSTGLDVVLKELAAEGKPLLGICLGMQLLFEKGYEYGEHEGLGLIKGSVVPMEGVIPADLKIPHIGWNALKFKNSSPCFKTSRTETACTLSIPSTPPTVTKMSSPLQNTAQSSPPLLPARTSLAVSSTRKKAAQWVLRSSKPLPS